VFYEMLCDSPAWLGAFVPHDAGPVNYEIGLLCKERGRGLLIFPGLLIAQQLNKRGCSSEKASECDH
jgi:hypothetical protein